MYFDFHMFFRLARLSFRAGKHAPTSLTCKRISFLIAFFTVFPIVQLFNAFCFWLDDMFFPGYREIDLQKSVFIVGNPRSGTTLMHRIMAKDERNFFCFRTWEIFFPAIIQKKVLRLFGRIDRLLGEPLKNRIERYETRAFHDFARMHKLGLFIPEEDDKLLMHAFSSFDLIWFFPFLDEFTRLTFFDLKIPDRERTRIMSFYRNCVKRQAYFKGNKGRLLSKSPHFSSKIDSLYRFFPDCRIIYMIRNPLEVIPSMTNMAHEIWRSTANINAGYLFQDKVYESARFNYDYPLMRFEKAPSNSYLIVRYDELIREPSRVVQSVYQSFGFEMTSETLSALKAEEESAKTYKSSHVYSIDGLDFPKEKIVRDLDNVFARFGFEKQ